MKRQNESVSNVLKRHVVVLFVSFLSFGGAFGAGIDKTDIAYAPDLGAYGLGDLYLPAGADESTPVVLTIHGGGWSGGDRASWCGVAKFFRDELGFAAFNIEYRLASADNRWPACGNDCVRAAEWLLSPAFTQVSGLSPKKIWICGGSAGGHLTLWTLVNLDPSKVTGAVSISAIGDPAPDAAVHASRYSTLFGSGYESRLSEMNPIPLIGSGMAPLLCTHANGDEVVPIASHQTFATAYQGAGNSCEFFTYASDCEPNEGGHFIWRTGSSPHRLLQTIETRIRTFVEAVEPSLQPVTRTPFGGASPNARLVTRVLDCAEDKAIVGAINEGKLLKTGSSELALLSPTLGAASEISVADGRVKVDCSTRVSPSDLPTSITDKIRLWLDASANVSLDGTLINAWFDRREPTDVSEETAAYPYAKGGVKVIPADSDGNERRPQLVQPTNLPGHFCVDFGPARTDDQGRWLRFANATTAAHWVYAREAFVVFAKRSDNFDEGYVTLLSSYYKNPANNAEIKPPVWTSNTGCLFYGTDNTRADKCEVRVDGADVVAMKHPVTDDAWHVLNVRIPLKEDECKVNQIGLDRAIPKASGGARIAEIILSETRFSDNERIVVEDYLRRKWLGQTVKEAGRLAVAKDAEAEIRKADGARLRLAGAGSVVVRGSEEVMLSDDGFGGAVELDGAIVRQDRLPFRMVDGQALKSSEFGYVRDESADSGVAVKRGARELTVSEFAEGVSELKVEEGTLRLAPNLPADAVNAPAAFPNANFEKFMYYKSASECVKNFTGSGGQCSTNENWVFDRSAYQSGGALVQVIFEDSRRNSLWAVKIVDTIGLGWEGSAAAYLCEGSLSGRFTLANAGRSRLMCQVGTRDTQFRYKNVQVLVDGMEVGRVTSFSYLAFRRWEIPLPYLAAGEHTVTFKEDDATTTTVFLFDDVKVIPESTDAGELAVAIANPGFESPDSNIRKNSATAWLSLADLTGWTVKPTEPTNGAIIREWYDEVTGNVAINNGQTCYPEEMPEGFVAAQIHGLGAFGQTVTLPSAGRYRLSFALAKRIGMMPQTVEARIGGRVVKKVTVRHCDFRRYEAVFDLSEGGDRDLVFAGTVANTAYPNNGYMNASAWLDDVSLVRVATGTPANLVENGGFESGSGGWTLSGSAALTSAYSGWLDSLAQDPLQGSESLVLGKTASGASRTVSFPSVGRYRLAFRMRARVKYPERTGTSAQFAVMLGDETLYAAHLLTSDRERTVSQAFAVSSAGERTLDFSIASNTSAQLVLSIDDVEIIAEPATSTVPLDVFGSALAVEVASGATIALDYDGVARVKSVRLAGRRVSGLISAAQYPSYISGRGRLYVQPRGTCMTFR